MLNEKQVLTCELIELYSFLGKRWSVILFHNLSSKPTSFNDLNRLTQKKISSILLSTRLKEMQNFKLIKRVVVNGRVCYVLTKAGSDLKRDLHVIKDWAVKNKYSLPQKCKEGKCICEIIR